MKLAIISFTKQGSILCGQLNKRFRELGYDCTGYAQNRFLLENTFQETSGLYPISDSLTEWTEKNFVQMDGLIYIGATGIAVRAIAPYLKDKMTDPAVVVMDDQGTFSISLLSGHVGGANGLAHLAATIVGATPVITTATDGNKKTAIDMWAKERGLTWSDRELAKQISAAVLEDKTVGFYSDYPLAEPVPEGFVKGELCSLQVWITTRMRPETDHMEGILRLIPRALYVGIGCRKGTPKEVIREMLERVFETYHLDCRAIAQIASISIKEQEAGLIQLASEMAVLFQTYSPATLAAAEGDFTASAFVQEVTGVDNVCERAALTGAGPGSRLIVKKQAGQGVTIAVAEKRLEIKRTEP